MSDSGGASAATCVFILTIIISLLLGNLIRRVNFKYATEGSVALLVGLVVGGIVTFRLQVAGGGKSEDKGSYNLVQFDDSMFFQVLLPPIIFNAGYSVKKKLFFQNFLTICFFGALGTMTCYFIISKGVYHVLDLLDFKKERLPIALALGAIFSATDTVATLQILNADKAPILHSLVFGEGVVNDACAIVLLNAISNTVTDSTTALSSKAFLKVLLDFSYLFVLSLLLGVGVGLLSALVMRFMLKNPSVDREVALVAALGLLAYSLAEAAHLSAILAVFFCGITMSHYTWHSLSLQARSITRHTFHVLSVAMETILFIYSGLDMWCTALWRSGTFSSEQSVEKILVLAISITVLIVFSRALFIWPTCWLANMCWRTRHYNISIRSSIVLWWSGLARGSITLAMTYHHFSPKTDQEPDPNHQIIIIAAVGVVLLTTVGFGIITTPFMDIILPDDTPLTLQQVEVPLLAPGQHCGAPGGGPAHLNGGGYDDDTVAASQMVDANERLWLHSMWKKVDRKFIQPVFGGSSSGVGAAGGQQQYQDYQRCDPGALSPH